MVSPDLALDQQQQHILQEAKDNLLEAVNGARHDEYVINRLNTAAQVACAVLPPFLAGMVLASLSDIAQALRSGETLSNDVPIKVAEEILEMHEQFLRESTK